MSTKQVSNHVMQLEQLIAAPLIATVDADTLATRRYLEAVQEIAFVHDPSSGAKQLRMLEFSYSSNDVSGSRQRTISVPMLSMVMLPLLQIQEADFEFDIRILDAVSEEQSKTFSFSETKPTQEEPVQSKALAIRASLAPSSRSGHEASNREQSLTANMHIKIKMRQADLPGGLANLLHMTAGEANIEDSKA